MKTIVNPNGKIHLVIGKQKKKDVEYRLMKYLLRVEVEDGVLLHNIISGCMVYLPLSEWPMKDGLPQCCTSDMDKLIEGYFLVPTDFDEYEFVRGLRQVLQLIERNKQKPVTKYTILPTTCCNAHCFYCYESEVIKKTMSKKTAGEVADFICDNCGGEPIEISWFGGEPTLGESQIDIICSLLKAREIEYRSSMISNGYLFTPELVDKAVNEWKLDGIQITLDGTEEVYNRTKSFNVRGSAYRRVLDNIGLLLDAGVHVIILLNVDYYNISDLYTLAEELSKAFPERENLRVTSHVLFNDAGYETVHHSNSEAEELAVKNHELVEYMQKIGLNADVIGGRKRRQSLPTLKYLYCMVHNNGSVVIDPEGNFHKCEHVNKNLSSSSGLSKGWFSEEETNKWFSFIEYEKCRECLLYPNCLVPECCENYAGCYPVNVEECVEQYRSSAWNIYQDFVVNDEEVL